MSSNVAQNVVFASPTNFDARTHIAESCVRNLHIEFPALIDGIENTTESAYTGWPDRLYVIGRDGRILYKSAPGPFGFNPSAMAATLASSVQ